MIKLHSLPAVVDTRKRRISRGYSSTKGKTGGRGMNGQRAKGRVQAGFEGGQMPLIKRLKMIRGKGFVGGRKHTIGVNIATLVKFFAKDELVTIQALQAKGLIKDDVRSVKILGAGTVKDKLKFAPGFKFSAHAAEKIGLK